MKRIYFILILLFASNVIVFSQKEVSFKIKNAGFNTEGYFKKYTSKINYNAANPAASTFEGIIDVNSIDTDIKKRDEHLRNEDYFDVAKYSSITFKSTSVKVLSNDKLEVVGNLTIKKITKPIKMIVTIKNVGTSNEFSTSININRRDFEVGGKSLILSDMVNINLKLKA